MQKVAAINCNRPGEDNSIQVAVITPLFGILAILFFLLRVLARFMTGIRTSWGWDDWAMVPTVVSIPDSPCTDRILIRIRLLLFR